MKTLLTNSRVWLGRNSFTDSIGLDSETGRINFVGSDTEAKKITKEYDEVIDQDKKLVLPAFTDGHFHFVKGSFVNAQLDLRNAETKNDFVSGIKNYMKNFNGEWIYGGHFSESNFREEIKLDRVFLDEICQGIPLMISRFDTHSAFANTRALELSGILSKVGEFTEDEIVKTNGSISGELKERAREYVLNKIPAASLNERVNVVLSQMEKLHSFGITSISDITLNEDLDVYKELAACGKLLLHVDSRLPFYEFHNLEKYRKEFSEISNLIKFRSLKAFYDGSLSSKTAYMFSNYKNTNHNGIKMEPVNSGEFQKKVFELDDAGVQMSVHAIGDKAVSDLLDLNEELIIKSGKKDRRFRIEHAQHIQEKDFRRFKELNVIASIQPAHLFSDAKTSFEILDDYESEHNYKKLFDIGATVCLGTDFPVVSADPFENIYYAMTRKVQGFEHGFVTGNRISLINCLEGYTKNNAIAEFEEDRKGSLVTGKIADIIVLNNNLFEMNPDEIKNAKVYQTYFGGKIVFQNG